MLTPMERRLWGLSGVEYLYGTARPGVAMLTVRFKVNEPLEQSLVKVRQELEAKRALPLDPDAAERIANLVEAYAN